MPLPGPGGSGAAGGAPARGDPRPVRGRPTPERRLRPSRLASAALVLALALGWAVPAPRAWADDDRPQAFYVLLDLSSSMNSTPQGWQRTKLEEARQRLGEFLSHLPYETAVHVFTFSDGLSPGPTLVLTSEAERAQLRAYFQGLEAKGRATFAWSSLDRVLARARQHVERAPGLTVRVLMYTDGEDNEQPRVSLPGVLERYRDLLRSGVEANVIPMGFQLDLGVISTLEAGGIPVIPALRAEDLVPLVALIDWEPLRPTTRDEVHFIDASRGAVAAYAWAFGDGQVSAEKAPRHRYAKAGTYAVTLEVKGFTGRTHRAQRRLTVAEPEPVRARAKATPLDVAAGAPVQFVSESSGAIQAYEWAFGDGATSHEANPAHVYAGPGSYTARLTVRGLSGERESAEVGPIVVKGPEAPRAAFHAPERALVGESVRCFDASRGVVDGRAWAFGDGEGAGDLVEVEHVYRAPGTFTIALTARGPGGESRAERTLVVAAPPAPVAALAAPATVRVGEEALLSDVSQGLVDTATWRLSDGSPETRVDYRLDAGPEARTLRRTFAAEGEVEVTLTVTGPGGSHAATRRLTVRSGETPPAAEFSAEPESGRAPLEVTFRNRSSGSARRFTWSFGDGSPPRVEEGTADVRHVYEGAGPYEVTLLAEGPPGLPSSSRRRTLTVEPPPGWFERHRVWVLPLGALLLAGLALMIRRGRAAAWLRGRQRFAGTLQLRPASHDEHPFADVAVARSSGEARVPLREALSAFALPETDPLLAATLVVRVQVSEAGGQTFEARLEGSDGPAGSAPLDPVEPARLAGLDLLFRPQ